MVCAHRNARFGRFDQARERRADVTSRPQQLDPVGTRASGNSHVGRQKRGADAERKDSSLMRSSAPHMRRSCRESLVAVLVLSLGSVATASAATKTCGSDPGANTTTILCAGSSICNGTSVTVKENLDLANNGCTFDVGSRTLSIQRTIQIIGGNGFMQFVNAGNTTITDTGKLKARGDQNPPGGFTTDGGLISITSSGTVTAISGALFDTSGDASGTVRLTAVGDVTLNGGGAAEVVRGVGISSFVDEGERF